MKGIDLFAGLGGSTLGAKQAGIDVVWAANHWQSAVDIHRLNHPEVTHSCQDLHQADWGAVPRHDILCASPSCQGHSRGRGKDKPHHDSARATAWAVVSCAEAHLPAGIVVENVPEFKKWVLFEVWCAALARLGYAFAPHILDAADHGVPQHRQRLFVILTRSKSPLWIYDRLPARAHVAASAIVDFEAGKWTATRGLCARTRERVRNGRKQHGERFLIAYYGNEHGGRSLARPLGTVTTRDRYAVVDGNRARMLSVQEYRKAMDFPESYLLPSTRKLATHLLGNAVCPPVMRDVLNVVKERL